MQFRPCIDIHDGKVKQIVGGSLREQENSIIENFVSEQEASFFANLYKEKKIKGGHVILLNASSRSCYEQTREQALAALRTYPGGLQAGGGITPENAVEYLDAGASHVIVTSYVFKDGLIHFPNLEKLVNAVGKEHLVLDLSCRKKEGRYYIVTDRWQKYTKVTVSLKLLEQFSDYCDEFLIHAVDVEGKAQGIETELVSLLGQWGNSPITYAGGIHSFTDLELLKTLGRNRVNVTIGSALDLFGGNLRFEEVLDYVNTQ